MAVENWQKSSLTTLAAPRNEDRVSENRTLAGGMSGNHCAGRQLKHNAEATAFRGSLVVRVLIGTRINFLLNNVLCLLEANATNCRNNRSHVLLDLVELFRKRR